ncbi:MAG TPA: excinuclease ABC subunit A [Solibacterales bacterium]|nr:excinuclease ABC subunit A [Bryobacterales bacterium]
MIRSFRCGKTENLNAGRRTKEFQDCESVARRKLRMLDAATALGDLKAPPNNQLEALKGNRSGQHSIRISGKWRLCFEWRDGNAHEVEIVDYH